MDIDRKLWSDEELEIFDLFDGKCIRFHSCHNMAEVIHEDVPKSRRPKTWMKKENRSPLCVSCHNWAHYKGTSYSSRILKQCKQEILDAKTDR